MADEPKRVDIYQIWVQFTTQNEERFFREFIQSFVETWEPQLQLDWTTFPTCAAAKPDVGPHLSRLPEELLPAIGKFLIISKDHRLISSETVSQTRLLVRCLIILCRHFDNIPFIASCDFVGVLVGFAAAVIHQLAEGEIAELTFASEARAFILSLCHFLESLYDPYFAWRNFLSNKPWVDTKLQYQPAFLHVEVVPFLYDCFETCIVKVAPELSAELLHVLGAIVAGAQNVILWLEPGPREESREANPKEEHNGLRAICPATVNVVLDTVVSSHSEREVRFVALRCFVVMVHTLQRSSPDQRQIEVGTMIQQLREVMRDLADLEWAEKPSQPTSPERVPGCDVFPESLDPGSEGDIFLVTPDVQGLSLGAPNVVQQSSNPDVTLQDSSKVNVPASPKEEEEKEEEECESPSEPEISETCVLGVPDTSVKGGGVCEAVRTFQRILSLDKATNTSSADILIENRVADSLLDLLYKVEGRSSRERQLVSVECVKTLSAMIGSSSRGKTRMRQDCSYGRLFSALKAQGSPSRDLLQALLAMSSAPVGEQLTDAEPLLLLVHWLPGVDRSDQFWLSVAIHQLCTATNQSKALACEGKVLTAVSEALKRYSSLDKEAAFELIRAVESLASVSITSLELKNLLMLLREDAKDKFPYHVQLLHAISSVARRDDLVECHSYFDIQIESDGIAVPCIKRWPGTGYGISFHVWVRLNPVDDVIEVPPNQRRQLFNMTTNTGTGIEMFFLPSGSLAVSVITKKEFLTATVPDVQVQDGHWHCLDICHLAARRPFGQNQLAVYIDGHQRLTAALKFPSTMDPFTSCYIGSPSRRLPGINSSLDDSDRGSGSLMLGAVGNLLPSIVSSVPNYFTLPLRSSSTSSPTDPNVKSYPSGMQDSIYGAPVALGGQVSLAALFHEALSYQQIRTLYEAGPSCRPLFCVEEGMEQADITSRLVFCYSASASFIGRCLDLSPGAKYEARVAAPLRTTQSVKTAINGLGGVHVLLPILEMASRPYCDPTCQSSPDLAPPLLQRRPSTPAINMERLRRVSDVGLSPEDLDDWEVLPSSSYSDWKLEQNPVSGFLSLLRNILTRSPSNQENLMKNNGVGIIGDLLTKVRPKLIDVNVLMAVQLMVEMARDTPNPTLLRALHHHILFNFHIWVRSQFHIRIGHIQYICTVVKEDRRAYRRRYGVQFVLDCVRQFHGSSLSSAASDLGPDVCLEGAPTPDDARTLRGALLGLVKYYLVKEVNVREVSALLGFLSSVKEETLVCEVLDMLTSHIESASCRDQLLLLLYEPQAAETLYCLLLDRSFSHDLKHKVLKLFSVLLRSERVYERHKTRLRLQDTSSPTLSHVGLYPGLMSSIDQSDLTMELSVMLLDQILLTDTPSSYAGALALLHALSSSPLEIKLEAARKILTTTFMRPTAAQQFSKQVGWQECITRLLVKRPIVGKTREDPRAEEMGLENLPDLMSFDEENLELIALDRPSSPSSVSRISAQVSDAASAIESEIKEVAETVAGNIHYAADNISSAMTSAYSMLRQKTLQDCLEELGETARSRLKRGSLSSLQDVDPSNASPVHKAPPSTNLLTTHDLDSLSLSNRSLSSSSTEDLSSPRHDSTVGESVVLDRHHETCQPISEDQLICETLEQWKELDAGKLGDREEELCYLVVNILFTIMWRGVEGASKDAWKERGQVLACINLLGLNNELHCSHLELKRRLLEMALQASVSDLRDEGVAGTLATHSENGAQLLRWAYDLVVLDTHGDPAKKCSVKLLDGVLSLVEVLLVFQGAEEWTEMAKLSFGILLTCTRFTDCDNMELVARASAKLHDLIRTRQMTDPEEAAYLLCYLDTTVQASLKDSQRDHYSFVMPVMKALLTRINTSTTLSSRLPGLPDMQTGPAFFEEFQVYSQTPEWRAFIDDKMRPLHRSYEAALLGELGDNMNTFWAECYEGSKTALQKRARDLADCRVRFQSTVASAFRMRQTEDMARLSGTQAQRKAELVLVRRSWRQNRRFLTGTRGAWRSR